MSKVDITKCKLGVEILHYLEGDPHDIAKPVRIEPLDPSELNGKTELEPIVNEDLRRFSDFYTKTLNNGSISRYELAAIKTYLHWKTHPEKK